MKSMQNNSINVLEAGDLKDFIKKLGLWDDFIGAKCKCRYCGDAVGGDNLHAFVPAKDHIEFCCSKASCLSRFFTRK